VSPVPASGVPFDDDGRALFHGAAQQDENRYAILDLTTGNRLSSYWLQSMVEFSRKHSTPEAIAGYLTAWSEANFVAELPEVTVPVTAIAGEHDPALGADTMKATWLTHIPSCELVTMANAGHYAMNETPIALATHLEQALRGSGQYLVARSRSPVNCGRARRPACGWKSIWLASALRADALTRLSRRPKRARGNCDRHILNGFSLDRRR